MRRGAVPILVAFLAAAVPSEARGDLAVLESLDWLVASSDAIHDGEVELWRPNGGRSYLLSVRTPPPINRRTPVVVPDAVGLFGTADPAGALTVGQRVIVFANLSDDGHRLVLRRLFREGHEIAVLRDGRQIEGLDEIGARVPARATPPRWPTPWVDLPHEKPGDPFATVSLRVPADRATERMLRARLEDDLGPRRAMAAAGLVRFESSRNVALLRALLDDGPTAPDGDPHRLACFWAARTLRAWEVPLPAAPCGSAPDQTTPPSPPAEAAPETARPAPAVPSPEAPPTWPPWGW